MPIPSPYVLCVGHVFEVVRVATPGTATPILDVVQLVLDWTDESFVHHTVGVEGGAASTTGTYGPIALSQGSSPQPAAGVCVDLDSS
jgi:hypothetical protein